MTAQGAEQRTTTMTTFAIDTDNHITAHATPVVGADSVVRDCQIQQMASVAPTWPAPSDPAAFFCRRLQLVSRAVWD